jgi:hypothetical protein
MSFKKEGRSPILSPPIDHEEMKRAGRIKTPEEQPKQQQPKIEVKK